MRRLILCSLLPLSACIGSTEPQVVYRVPAVPADLLRPCVGYSGPVPATAGQASDAWVQEWAGRRCANRRIEAVREILEAAEAS